MRLEVVMTVSDRPYYLEDTLKFWSKVRGVDSIPFTFYVEPSHVAHANNSLILDWKSEITGDFVYKINNESRLGVLVNPWQALDSAFGAGADFVILCEEDTPVSSDILEYFTWAALEFRSDPDDVLGVCAWSDMIPNPDLAGVCTLEGNFNPLVWGTWHDRWLSTLRNTWDKDYSTGNPDGSQAGWDWNIKRIMGRRRFVFPLQSRSDHIGIVGAHMRPQDFDQSVAHSFVSDRPTVKYKLVRESSP